MSKKSRARLWVSILTCEGLFATLKERLQWAPPKPRAQPSISDAAWSQFRNVLVQKAPSAVNREVIECNPAYTSQDCSGCGYRPEGKEGRTKKKLSDRWHLCPMCGLSLDRDTNAAVNIKALGQQCLPALTG